MIRINLLATDRRAAKAASKGIQAGQKMTVIGSLILVLATAGIGWRYFALGQQGAQLDRDIANAKREEQGLAEILKQVADFDARKQQLESRLALIAELRKGQNAPVHMIDQLSRSIPEMTWLTSVKQVGYQVTIEGRCLTLTSLSDFVGNLEATRYFAKPVDIVDSHVEPGDGKTTPDTIQFTIRGNFQMAGIDLTPPPDPRKRTPPPAKGGKRG
jgi:type IV pilus assembly protein PilN